MKVFNHNSVLCHFIITVIYYSVPTFCLMNFTGCDQTTTTKKAKSAIEIRFDILADSAIPYKENMETKTLPDGTLDRREWRVMVTVRGTRDEPQNVTPIIKSSNTLVKNINPESAAASAQEPAIFFVHLVKTQEGTQETEMNVTLKETPEISAKCCLPANIVDLAKLPWMIWHQGEYVRLADLEKDIPVIPGSMFPPRYPDVDSLSAYINSNSPSDTAQVILKLWKKNETSGRTEAVIDTLYTAPANTWEKHVVGPHIDNESLQLPRFWNDMGLTWLHARFVIPASYRKRHLRFSFGTAADAGLVFLNGRLIGRRDARGLLVCDVPDNLIKWDEENELCQVLENAFTGAGLYRATLTSGECEALAERSFFANRIPQPETERRAAEPLGERLPLRPIKVRNGILYYEDGGEVALWGTNFYPQSYSQFRSIKNMGIDPRKAMEDDFEDFANIGIDIIRIHVFDTEISDGKGNLIHNEHLDAFDYLVAQCNEHGIYLQLAPIAWWGSIDNVHDSFSRHIPKEAMSMWSDSWSIQANYIEQFLNHQNPYTGKRLVDEPCLTLLEIINEPIYWGFSEVTTRDHETESSDYTKALNGFLTAFHTFTPDDSWQTPEVFAVFRYVMLRGYIDAMIKAIRRTGAKQPVAYFGQWWGQAPELVQAVSDSRCEMVTFGDYPGWLPGKPVNDSKNFLGSAQNTALDVRYAKKARLVYEYDAAGTLNLVSMYPGLARHWRSAGFQVCCQFQYDSRIVAHLNRDWPQHYLNLWHTPEKMVSFMIGAEIFKRLPRGTTFPIPPDDQIFPPGAVSFSKNAAILFSEDCYMQARPTNWCPLPFPETPSRILSVGSTPYFEYAGTGVVGLLLDGNQASLQIYPDVERLRYDLRGSEEAPLTCLHNKEHTFRLSLPGWVEARVERLENGSWVSIPDSAGEFRALPGAYRLMK